MTLLKNLMPKTRGYSLLVAILLLTLGACSSSNDGENSQPFTAVFFDSETTTLEARGYENEPRIVLTGKVGTSYTITITEGGAWCLTSRRNNATSATGTLVSSRQIVYIYLDENDTGESRHAEITITFEGGETFLLTLDQESYSIPASLDHAWAELPAYIDDDDFLYVTHYAPISSTVTARNYTICFDKTKRIANWVAYPLHDCYMSGTYVRSNAWAFDPDVPSAYQADLSLGSYQNWQTNGIRGHQCMSNHRYVPYSDELNRQTFYSTNIMPQNSDFNSGSWGSMETIASAQRCSDTLYIVTGTYGVRSWSQDKAGTEVAMPEYCWKVLLRTRTGRTGMRIDQITDASELKSIGYWAENSSASKNGLQEYIVSVAYIEQQTGYKFFTMLDEAIADEVKSQNNPSDWGIN